MLVEILGLDTEPDLRPVYLEGFRCNLWGQYPDLLGGVSGGVVEGAVYEERSVEDAEILAEYETRNCSTVSCSRVGKVPAQQAGHIFLFDGNLGYLSDGSFDLRVWLERVGR